MDNETDPVEQLEQSLAELEEDGELDSENITFRATDIGGVHLDSLDETLEDVGYDKDPVRITIEPETENPEDHHYHVSFEYLEYDGRGRYVPSDLTARMDGLEVHLQGHDALVPSEAHDAPDSVNPEDEPQTRSASGLPQASESSIPQTSDRRSSDIGRNANGFMSFEVEADILEVDGLGREHTEYQIPDDIIDLVHDYGGELRDVALYPDGRGWGTPTYAIEIVVE